MVAAIRMHKRPRSETTRIMTDSVVNDGTDLALVTATRTLEPFSFRATKRSRLNHNNSDNNNDNDNDDSNAVLPKEETAAVSEPQLSQGSFEHHSESSTITKRVRFSDQEPQVISFSWFDDLTDEEEAQLRLQMWYTRRDFDEFCRDRVDTVRVWRSVGGGDTLHHELEAYYCLRGLEPYQSSRLNTQLHAQRLLHHQTLRNEQTRQRLVMMKQPPAQQQQQQYDHERLRQAVEKLSAWALQRARRLALLDQAWLEQERMREASASASSTMTTTTTSTKTSRQRPTRRRSSVARQVVAQHRQGVVAAAAVAQPRCHRRTASESCLPQGASVSAGVPESLHRESGTVRSSSSSSSPSNSSFLPTHRTPVSSSAMAGSSLASRRLPVDVNRLKQMNEEFLQRIMTNGKPTGSDGHLISSGSVVSTGLSSYSTHNSLHHPLTNTAPAESSIKSSSSQAQEEQRASMTALTAAVPPPAHAPVLGTSLESILLRKHRQQVQRLLQQQLQRERRHSLASSHATDPDKLLLGSGATSQDDDDDDPDVEAPLFIRRDSLHGLRYYHHHNPTGTLASSSPPLQLFHPSQEEEEEEQQLQPVAVESRT